MGRDRDGRTLTRMEKRSLSERDICTKFITPALRAAGWDEMSQLREEVKFTAGRIIVRGRLVARGKRKRADYVLFGQAEHSDRGDRGEGQQARRGRRHAAGAGLRRDPEHPVRVLLERRRLRVPRPHGGRQVT